MVQMGKWVTQRLRASYLVDTAAGLIDMCRPGARYGIKRSASGRLRIRFYGGPFYPAMVNDLERAFERFGHLVERGEELSGAQWADRIIASGQSATSAELAAIRTLLRIA
ncbi:hypothetical protein [Phytopseudomonas dryadis]|nr:MULTISPECIES: hypothetical protein [Pseudomonas]